MTKDEFKKLSEELKMDICREIAYEYAVFVPKDEPRAISKFKSIVYLSDKKFLENDVLEKADGGQIFPYNVIMEKVEKTVDAYYQEFRLGTNAQEALADYGERGVKFKTHFEKCIAESQENTTEYIQQELFGQLLRGNDVKATIKRVGEAISRRTNSLNRLIESLCGQMEQFMILCDYQDKGYTKYRINAIGENCEDCQSTHGKIFNIADCEIGENLPPFHPNCDCGIEIIDEAENVVYSNAETEKDEQNWGKYLQASIRQLVLGNYTDDVNLLGTLLQLAAGFIGVDLPLDVRDITYDLTNFKLTKEHIAQTILDAVALIPIVGGVKYVDEAGTVLKSGAKYGDEIADTAKVVNKMTAKEALEAAKKLGFDATGQYSHGQPIFKKGNRYITPDADSHNGGVWKMADSIKNLKSKKTRMGTYDANLDRIGD